VLFFSLAALVPAILVGAFSTSLISRYIDDLYGDSVRQNLDGAHSFLNKYLTEELRDLSFEVVNMERFLTVNKPAFYNRITYTAYLQRYFRTRDIDAVYVISRDGIIYARATSPSSPELRIPAGTIFDYMEKQGGGAVQTQDENDYLIGLKKLQEYDDAFLLVGKYLTSDVGVLSSVTGIKEARKTLSRYQTDQGQFSRIFILTFFETALLILFAAVWLGVLLANRLIEPLGHMVAAAEKVRDGDLTARVQVKGDWGEMSDLGSAFNRMTRQLSTQREDLVREHDISEQRRHFSEAVLSGVTAGVIGLTEEGRVTLMNASAERLTGLKATMAVDHPVEIILPEFAVAFQDAREKLKPGNEYQINFETPMGARNFDLRVSSYEGAQDNTGWVLTFDDMTRLVAAQRHSAWRDVARRIAHEIKNPLTPIQLAAERLQRKYKNEIKTNPKIFENCTDTIIRQVSSLEQMVDEFSSFARMPAPVFAPANVKQLLDAIRFEQGVAFPDIRFSSSMTADEMTTVVCDERLIGQALSNIYKNAAMSVNARVDAAGLDVPDGEIATYVFQDDKNLHISITDNGRGWPFPDKDRLLEPYVTTRDTGTGLGLAIVKRIVEDHGGQLALAEPADGANGARVEIVLPVMPQNEPLETPTKKKTKTKTKARSTHKVKTS
jgi:two-component system nitrogen regulation sensor histidine kinase NtrY